MVTKLDFLKRLAKGIATQFGRNCEIVIHDLSAENIEYSILHIENGHVTERETNNGPSRVVLNALKKNPLECEDKLNYITKTQDGRILKSSTIYIRDDENKPIGVFSINYDITELTIATNAINSIISHENEENDDDEVNKIPQNVNQLLDDLLEESTRKINKPVALMSKEEKIAAIQFLNDAGAFLITKAGDRIANHFGISKYSIYNYIDIKNKL